MKENNSTNHIWCEDTASGYTFWTFIFNTLYDGFDVESKKNNSELCKAAKSIENSDDNYYILMDNAIDNADVYRERKRLEKITQDKDNVTVINIHCFEFVLLSFELLEKWVFAENDKLKEKRKLLLAVKNVFVRQVTESGDSSELEMIKSYFDTDKTYNTEQISSKFLFEITRNTGFETNKSKLGACFVQDCCDWDDRKDDDICGLDKNWLSSHDKVRQIFEHSVLKKSFAEAGL